MAEHEPEELAANNPAMTAPASHQLPARRNSRFEIMSSPAGDIKVPEAFLKESKYEVGWRRVVRNFTPSWFSVTMGTGIVSVILYAIPFQARWLYWLSVIFLGLNSIIFAAALVISVLRYTLYPEIWKVMIRDGNQSLFLGTFPMGFATLVNAWIHLCVPYWGHWAITFAWVCWIIDSVVATATAISLPILLISASREQALHRITAVQLLPIVAPIVAAGTGAQVAGILMNPQDALGTLIASYIMWGIAVPLVYMVLVMYYQRLALHKLPPREVVVSSFLPLGPCGMGGYTIMHLGVVARTVFPQTHFLIDVPTAGDIVYVMGAFVALIMWSFAMVWLCFALVSIHKLRPFPFNMGWWGFTFPLGVLSTSTIQFGTEFSSLFFKVLGTIFGVSVILLWCVVTVGTIRGAIDGKLFYAPCLANLPKKEVSRDSGDEEKALPS